MSGRGNVTCPVLTTFYSIFRITAQNYLLIIAISSGTWDPNYWFFKYKSYELEKGPGCCSDSVISFHYVPPQQMYVYDYFIQRVGFRLGQTSEREKRDES